MNRAITFNARVILPGSSPRLHIAADGTVTASPGVTFTADNSPVVVGNISNTSSLGGKVALVVPKSVYDADPKVTATITGHAVFEFQTGFESVTIANQSDKHLRIEDITVQNTTGQEDQNFKVDVPEQSSFSWTPIISPGNTPIVIENTSDGDGDIVLNGIVDNPYGTVQIHAAGGDISAGSAANIETTKLSYFPTHRRAHRDRADHRTSRGPCDVAQRICQRWHLCETNRRTSVAGCRAIRHRPGKSEC